MRRMRGWQPSDPALTRNSNACSGLPLARDPNMVDACLWLYFALEEQGRDAEALEDLERAIRLDPLAHPVVTGAGDIR